jgi:HSP20 family protein
MTKNSEAVVKHAASDIVPATKNEWGFMISPASDIYESADAYVILMDLPGASKEDITLAVDNGVLTVKASSVLARPLEGKRVYSEIPRGTWQRAFTLGTDVNANAIDAGYENGVLAIKIGKNERARAKEIRVK